MTMKKLAILLLTAALLAGMLSVCSAVTLSFGGHEVDSEEPWYDLTDGLLTIFIGLASAISFLGGVVLIALEKRR